MTHPTKAIAATILLVITLSTHSIAQEMYAGTSMKKTSYATSSTVVEENNKSKTSVAVNPVMAAKFSSLVPGATDLQ